MTVSTEFTLRSLPCCSQALHRWASIAKLWLRPVARTVQRPIRIDARSLTRANA